MIHSNYRLSNETNGANCWRASVDPVLISNSCGIELLLPISVMCSRTIPVMDLDDSASEPVSVLIHRG